jgi:hypothetical protein
MSADHVQAFTVNIQKGGALLDDCRRVVEAWEPELDPAANLERISANNLLGKTSRTRTDDVLRRIIGPRLVEPGPHIIPALKAFLADPRAFREACYYETSRDEPLLASFAEGPLFQLWASGRIGIQVDDVTGWLMEQQREGRTGAWSDQVRTKVARGLLAALRDFGILTGARTKEIAPPDMTPRGFVYVAWRLHEQGASSRALATSPTWRRWLLGPARIDDLFTQAARLGMLSIVTAGSAVRIDWHARCLEEVTGATA